MTNYSDVLQKLVLQKKDHVARIDELRMTDPFNLDSTLSRHDDGVSPDDIAQDNEIHERVSAQIHTLEQLILSIDAAIERIELGSYGVCSVCGDSIDSMRLSIMPFAATCLKDEKVAEQLQKKRLV